MPLEIELPDGTILEAPDDADPSEVAKAYLAKQQLQSTPSFASKLAGMGRGYLRSQGLGTRAVLEGGMDVVSPFADVLGLGLNAALPGQPFPPSHSQAFSQLLTQAGLPEPQGGAEGFSNTATRLITGMGAGLGIDKVVRGAMGAAGGAPAAIEAQRQAAMRSATGPGAATLTDAGVPLDRGQRSGNVLANRMRSAFHDNPMTAGAQAKFTESQQRAFTQAALRTVGAEGDEATQSVMNAARSRIGGVFNEVAKKSPAVWDEAIEGEVSGLIQEASRTLDASELKLLQNNVDDILNAVGRDGTISGDAFNRINTTLGRLSTRQNVGHFARDLQESLLGALERSSPDDASALRMARQQWRSLNIISGAIGRGEEKFISPLRLSNAVASLRNRAMSVYGLGGDQNLVSLAEAGRSALPEVLPQSGTVPRGLMAAPLRSLATAPGYRALQGIMNRQPQMAAPLPSRLRPMLPFLLGGSLQQTGELPE